MTNKNVTFSLLTLLASLTLFSQNPIVTHMYTADPTARVFNGTLYLFPSTDIVCEEGKGENGFCMPSYNVFSTQDLTTWTDHGKIIDQTDVPWGVKDGFGMWAPDCVEKDGMYYYYYPAPPLDKSGFRRVGVATATKPEGPYILEKSYIKGVNGIDPNVLNDDDGKSYIYFGGGKKLFVAELNSDMKSIKGKATEIEGLPEGYKEGPFMFKKDGVYYFTFPHDASGSEEIAYGTGLSPKGPFKYQGKIMERWKDGIWTNHHSIVEYKKQWYIFYHHHDVSNDGHLRSMRVDSLFFDKKGKILEKKATLRGVGITKTDKPIQIDRFTHAQDLKVSRLNDENVIGWQLDHIKPNTFVTYNSVEFSKHYKNVTYRVSSGSKGGNIKLYVDNKFISETRVDNTGGWTRWKEVTTDINKKIDGIKNIKLVFEGQSDYLMNVDWVKFQ